MNPLKNKEIKISLIALILAVLVFGALFWLFFGALSAVLCAFSLIALWCVFYVLTVSRLRRIDELSRSLDKILHGYEEDICEYTEGELQILSSVISKLLHELKTSEATLREDKIKLTDSIADISHQLRTPLTSINIMVSMLAERELSDERRMELVSQFKQLLNRIDRLIETLLKLSKIDAGVAIFENVEIEVKELVKQAVMPLEAAIDLRSQRLVIDCDDGKINGDIGWLSEALGNIVKNCMEHNRENGTITVTSRKTPIFTELTVSDEGQGIDEKDLPHIFERFYRGRQGGNGVGVGLALAASVLRAQNATVKAKNTATGATFVVRFYK